MSDEATSRSIMRRVTTQRSPKVLYDDMVAMLKRLEWAGEYNGCPECGGLEPGANQGINPTLEGHATTCDLATLLRELP